MQLLPAAAVGSSTRGWASTRPASARSNTGRTSGSRSARRSPGSTCAPEKRDFLKDLLERSTTGAKRVRAGVPQGSKVANKTGTGSYGTANDIAVVWPPGREPILVAIMSSRSAADAKYDEALIAEATAYVVRTLI